MFKLFKNIIVHEGVKLIYIICLQKCTIIF